MYRLQWATIFKDGKVVDVNDFVYHNTEFEYEDYDEAFEDRMMMQSQTQDKHIRIVKVD